MFVQVCKRYEAKISTSSKAANRKAALVKVLESIVEQCTEPRRITMSIAGALVALTPLVEEILGLCGVQHAPLTETEAQ